MQTDWNSKIAIAEDMSIRVKLYNGHLFNRGGLSIIAFLKIRPWMVTIDEDEEKSI